MSFFRCERNSLRRAIALAASAAMFVSSTLAVSGLLDTAAAKKPDYQLKIATLAPDGSTWMKLMRELDDRIRQDTDNAVGLKFYPGGIQGDEPVVLRKIRTGQLHGAGFTGVGLGEIAPSLRVMELPFLFQSNAEVAAVHAKLDPQFESTLSDKGYKVLGWADVGFVYLYSKDRVEKAEDLRANKVWLWEGDPLAQAFLERAGVSPVPLSITDVMTSLQTGLISSVYITPLACIALQWFTRVQYTIDVPITHAMGAVVVTDKAWAKVPEEHRPVIENLAGEYFERLRVATIEENKKSIDVIAESGVEVISPSAEDLAAYREIGKDVASALTGKLYDAALLAAVTAELEAQRARTDTP